MEKYDKAVEFVQAEKLFYEAVFINYHGSKRESKSRYAPANKCSDPVDFGDLLVKKASKFNSINFPASAPETRTSSWRLTTTARLQRIANRLWTGAPINDRNPCVLHRTVN